MMLRRLGLIVNPAAGAGRERNLSLGRRALLALEPVTVVTAPGSLGGDAAPNAEIVTVGPASGRAATSAATRAIAASGVDAMVVIGGDGTLADVAGALHVERPDLPIVGVGAGSTNAGALVTCHGDRVDALTGAALRPERVTALRVTCTGGVAALAFNDVVVGATIVGTLDGAFTDLDAAAVLDGLRRPGTPRPVGGAAVVVTKHRGERVTPVAGGTSAATLVVGLVDAAAFFGKALIGGVGLSALAGLPAGALVASHPLVRTSLHNCEHDALEPLVSTYVGLAPGDVLRSAGFGPPAVLCADGNPLRRLSPSDVVEVSVRPGACTVVRGAEGGAR